MAAPYAEVVGDPVAHSKSPLVHNFWLERLAMEGDYRALRVAAGELPAYFERRRCDPDWRGCSLTMPLKEIATLHVDRLDEAAAATGAVNCVFREGERLVGANTDGLGIAEAVGALEARDAAILIGAGGAARALLHHLRGREVVEVHIVARDVAKARRLLDSLGLAGAAWSFDDDPLLLFPMLLANATPLGMAGAPPLPRHLTSLVDRIVADGLVFDMIYDPAETPLLAAAKQRGLATRNGLPMLIGQAREAFRLFFGQSPPLDLDGELEELLTS